MRRFLARLCVLALLAGAFALAPGAAHAQYPLWVEDPSVQADGETSLRIGADYALVGQGIELYRFPSLYWKTGVGGVGEGIIVFNLGEVNQDGDEQGWDIESFSVASKLCLHESASPNKWDTSLAFGVKIPSSDTSKGVGVDATDFHARLLAARNIGDTRIILNGGVGILEKVTNLWGQDDILEWGAAAVTPISKRGEVMLELSGNTSSSRGPSSLMALAGVRHRLHNGNSWDAYARWGLTGQSDNVAFGVGYTINAELFPSRVILVEPESMKHATLEELLSGKLAHLSDEDKQAIREFFAAQGGAAGAQ